MTAFVQAARVVREGTVVARADFRAFYTWRTWLGAWLVRILCQVLFYGLLATAVGDPDYVLYALLGAAMMISVAEVMMTCASTTWDINLGTLPLLASSPVRPGWFYLGRSAHWPASGVATTVIALCAVPPFFGQSWPPARLPLLLVLVVLSTCATYAMALLFGVVALRAPGARNVISTVVTLTTTAFCGALVPLDYWPALVGWSAQAVPVTHGLAAVRALATGAGAAAVASSAALTALTGLVWLAVAIAAADRVFRRARRDGTLFM